VIFLALTGIVTLSGVPLMAKIMRSYLRHYGWRDFLAYFHPGRLLAMILFLPLAGVFYLIVLARPEALGLLEDEIDRAVRDLRRDA